MPTDGHDDPLRPGSREFIAVLDEVRDLFTRKGNDYGTNENAFSNIDESAAVVNIAPWSACVLRIADKLHRLKAFHRRGKCEFDGVEDTLLDGAVYFLIALVKYRQSVAPTPEPTR
jgi:hypothetical protein